jgi:hypothetical protein
MRKGRAWSKSNRQLHTNEYAQGMKRRQREHHLHAEVSVGAT